MEASTVRAGLGSRGSSSKHLREVSSFSGILFAISAHLCWSQNYRAYLRGFHSDKFKIIPKGNVLVGIKCHRACTENSVEYKVFSKDPLCSIRTL